MNAYPQYKESGVEWIGEIPAHWEMFKISHSFGVIGSGTTPSAGNSEYHHNGTIPWVNTGDLNDGRLRNCARKITEKAFQEHSTLKIYPFGTLLIAMYGATIGKVAILEFEACTNQACCALSESKNFDVQFVFYWFVANKSNIISLSYGGGQPNISQETIKSLRLPCPKPSEQTAIATYLDGKTTQIDTLITKKQRLIELLREERTAIISHAVTKGLDATVPLKDSGVAWIGEIPKTWRVQKIKYLGKITNGYAFSSDAFENYNTGCRVLKISNIQTMRIEWRDESFIDEDYYDKLQTYRLYQGDLVFALTRPIISTGIKAAIIQSEDKILINQRNAVFRASKKIMVNWMYYILINAKFVEHFESLIDVTGQQPNISSTDIGGIFIPIPPTKEQTAIATYLDEKTAQIDALIAKTEEQVELLQEYRTALISSVVTGKVDVREEVMS